MSPAARRTSRRQRRHSRLSPKLLALLIFLIVLASLAIFGIYHAGGHSVAKTAVSKTSTKTPAAQAPQPKVDAALNTIIASWASHYSFTSSVVVTELTGSQRTASYQPTTSMVPASTYKIYVAYAVLHAIEQGTYTLQTKTDDGNTIQIDLSNMILNSDNDAARTLGFLYGWQNINTLLKAQGITNTNLYNYVPPSTLPVGDKHTTAADLAATVQKLYAGKLLNAANTQLLLGLMEQQQYRERIPAGVPASVTVADKPGWLSPADGDNEYVENDAAIVYGPRSTYLLVITTNGGTTQPLTTLSTSVYNYLEQ